MKTDATLTEELRFIHAHIEAIDTTTDGIHEELKALVVTISIMARALDRLAEGANHERISNRG